MTCKFCNKPLETDNNTEFCDEQCEYDYKEEYGTRDE